MVKLLFLANLRCLQKNFNYIGVGKISVFKGNSNRENCSFKIYIDLLYTFSVFVISSISESPYPLFMTENAYYLPELFWLGIVLYRLGCKYKGQRIFTFLAALLNLIIAYIILVELLHVLRMLFYSIVLILLHYIFFYPGY